MSSARRYTLSRCNHEIVRKSVNEGQYGDGVVVDSGGRNIGGDAIGAGFACSWFAWCVAGNRAVYLENYCLVLGIGEEDFSTVKILFGQGALIEKAPSAIEHLNLYINYHICYILDNSHQ